MADYNDEARGDYKNGAEKLADKGINLALNKAKSIVKQKIRQGTVNVAKKLGHLVVKGVVAIFSNPVTFCITVGVIVIFFIVVNMMSKTQVLLDFIETQKKGIYTAIAQVLNWDMYDEQKTKAWNEAGEDPDKTYLLYSLANAEAEGTVSYGSNASDADKTSIKDFMRTDNGYLAPEDMLQIFKDCEEYNSDMFEINSHEYTYHEWAVEEIWERPSEWTNPTFMGFGWKEHDDVETNTDDDGLYGTLIAENVRGEKQDGERIYTVHWQDIYTLALMYAEESEEKWGTSADSQYEAHEDKDYVISSTDQYWVTDEDLEAIFSLFGYKFNYYYDAVADKTHQKAEIPYYYKNMRNGASNPAYRFFRDADHDQSVYDYHWYGSREEAAQGEKEPRETRFVPDSAPNIVYNSLEQYKYAYVPTTDVPGYVPDPQNFTPPDSIYCVGKWKIVDPRPFVNSMADLCPSYRIEAGADRANDPTYVWSDTMLDLYIFYLEYTDLALGTDRASYYEHIKELYRENKIEVSYYGMKLPDDKMDSFVEKLKADNPGMEFEFDYSHARDYGDFYDVEKTDPKAQAEAGSIPFPSYGVSFNGTYIDDIAGYSDRTGNKKNTNYSDGEIYVSQHGSYVVDGWIHLEEGADTPLDSGYTYTESQIRGMLAYLNNYVKGRSGFDFTKATADIYKFHQDTGADIAGILAIICTECSPKIGNVTWNWFNYTATENEQKYGWYITTGSGHRWYNPKARYEKDRMGYQTVEGACMVDIINKIVYNYWKSPKRLQNTYFRMTWNQYGWDLAGNTYYPQDWDSALVEEGVMEGAGHCYCPWWEDEFVRTYKRTGIWDSSVLWCNVTARHRMALLSSAGIDVQPAEPTGILFIGDSRTICCFSDSSESTISGQDMDGITVYAGWGKGYDFMVSSINSAGDFDTLALWLGCNDAAQGKSFTDDYGPYLDGLLADGKKIILFNVGRTKDEWLAEVDKGKYTDANMRAYNSTMSAWANGKANVTYVDTYFASMTWSLNESDGIHYSPRPTTKIWNFLKAYLH